MSTKESGTGALGRTVQHACVPKGPKRPPWRGVRGWQRCLPGLLLAALLPACDGTAITDAHPAPRLRVFNAVINQSTQFPTAQIDVLVDGTSSAPGTVALPFGSATPYAEFGAEPRVLLVRLNGDQRDGEPANILRFTPRLRLVPGFDYTVVVSGIVPDGGIISTGDVVPTHFVDDAFPPTRSTSGEYRARFKLVNAAPFAGGGSAGSLVRLYLTPGTEPPPASIASLAEHASVRYRAVGGSVELDAGTYHLTVANQQRTIIAQEEITLPAGAARTLVLVSSGSEPTAPSPSDHALITLVDGDY